MFRKADNMKNIYLINYAVKGIKNLDDWAELSFYNKTIRNSFSVKKFNVKGIYGINGAGKSGIIRSAEILKHLLIDPYFLNDSYVQRLLNDLVNKKTKVLGIRTDFLRCDDRSMRLYHYEITVEKNHLDTYVITSESLSVKNASSSRSSEKELYHTYNGVLSIPINNKENEQLIDQTKNLLSNASLLAAVISNSKLMQDSNNSEIWKGLRTLLYFAISVFVCMDSGDDHRMFYVDESLSGNDDINKLSISRSAGRMSGRILSAFSADKLIVKKEQYSFFEKRVSKLSNFLQIFKGDLKEIVIDRKEDEDSYICSLIMKYDGYSIDAEFESTGIKKLIRLFDYFDKMVHGDIVFIDELDSNLHDVYLCALLEYLMENAEGQLCFTTHNIGPMDILKKNKKSIDFLSEDHKIYSWTNNGNYSPSSLYKNGMIEGSAFNVFSFDFLSAFHSSEDDE